MSRALTPDEAREAVRRYKAGEGTVDEIAADVGASASTLYRLFRDLGLRRYRPRSELIEELKRGGA